MAETTQPPRSNIVKVVGASMAGTTVEWYDFFLFGVAAALVFPQVFFPESDPAAGALLALGTFAVGFIARPIGGLVFGHYGDKIGRKTLLVISLLMMGGATFAIGLLPGYAVIGFAAPLILVLLRVIQGFALGGEWGGAVLIVSEHGDPKHRGYWASWPQAGAPGGQLLANGLLALLAAFQNEADFLAWGWRIPFLLSAVLVLIGLYVRLSVFGTKVRYSGVSVGYQLASVFAGGLAPLIAVALYTSFDSGYAVSVYLAVSALITIVAVASYSETRHRDLAEDHALPKASVR